MHSLHETFSNNGVRLATLALQYGLVVGGTLFPLKARHKGTWISPDGNTVNQIDHVLVRQKHRTSLLDTRVYTGADCDSDHLLVVAREKMKLSTKRRRMQTTRKIDVSKLKEDIDGARTRYHLEISNRFAALETAPTWEELKGVILEAAESSLGFVDGGRRGRNIWHDDEC